MDIQAGASLIVFTDLDGTLLDHETYSYEPAREALEALQKKDIPLILASSKTSAELLPLREELGFQGCEAIVENGAGILRPGSSFDGSEREYQRLLDTISEAPKSLAEKFKGFSQMSAREVSGLTGLDYQAASLAKQRQFSEPGLWQGSKDELETFSSLLSNSGVVMQRGGRFVTFSFGGNKAQRMTEILGKFRSGKNRCFCVAIGDAPNDAEMLETADLGVVIANPAHSGIGELNSEKTGRIVRTTGSGPKAWNTVVLEILYKLGSGD